MENANTDMRNWKVEITFFQMTKTNKIMVKCNVILHLQSTDAINAIAAACLRMEMRASKIEDVKVEREL